MVRVPRVWRDPLPVPAHLGIGPRFSSPANVHYDRKQHGEKHHFQCQHVDHDPASVLVPDDPSRCHIKPIFGKERAPARDALLATVRRKHHRHEHRKAYGKKRFPHEAS